MSSSGIGGAHIEAELGPVKLNIEPSAKVGGYADDDGLGFKAELKAAEADVGPANAKLGLGVSTGIDTKDGLNAEVLGTGLGVNSERLELKVLGSSVGVKWPWKWFD